MYKFKVKIDGVSTTMYGDTYASIEAQVRELYGTTDYLTSIKKLN